MVELQKVTREKDKLIDENEQLQQRTDMLIINYEKEKQVSTFMYIIKQIHTVLQENLTMKVVNILHYCNMMWPHSIRSMN